MRIAYAKGKYSHQYAAEVRPDAAELSEHCLCLSCSRLRPPEGQLGCGIAHELFKLCREHDLMTPVARCPQYNPKVRDGVTVCTTT